MRESSRLITAGEDCFEPLESADFDLLHDGFALEEVAPEVGGEPRGTRKADNPGTMVMRVARWEGKIKENGETWNKKRGERDKKAIAGGDAGPIGITGDEKIKREKGWERERCAPLPRPENKRACVARRSEPVRSRSRRGVNKIAR